MRTSLIDDHGRSDVHVRGSGRRRTEPDGWPKRYDVEQIAREVKPDDWALFLRVLDETKVFAEAVNLAREQPSPVDAAVETGTERLRRSAHHTASIGDRQ
ncbi:hypothetical protein [Thermomonospora echinospora]|uniref:hypothetical protein n=1 Tax=Thermomonospora echinospora TaxID=1992 RepID=UPI0011B06916|nr:hypothetical protein [Thermomonospora echinospora]